MRYSSVNRGLTLVRLHELRLWHFAVQQFWNCRCSLNVIQKISAIPEQSSNSTTAEEHVFQLAVHVHVCTVCLRFHFKLQSNAQNTYLKIKFCKIFTCVCFLIVPAQATVVTLQKAYFHSEWTEHVYFRCTCTCCLFRRHVCESSTKEQEVSESAR